MPFLSRLFQSILYENWSLSEPNFSIPLSKSGILNVYSKLNKAAFRYWLGTRKSRIDCLIAFIIRYLNRRKSWLIRSINSFSKNEVKYCFNYWVLFYRLIFKGLRACVNFINRIKWAKLLISITCGYINWFCDYIVPFSIISKLSKLWYSLNRPLYL